ncbi:fructose-6-phosphate aldolase [Candidatus Gracilibacteria bacterium]|nr:fructose-6-phosphate aldolase [Candidatus Gracilibacteria bacterium]
MKLFLDTANLDDITKGVELGLLDGVTTNPSLIVKEGLDFETVIKKIAKMVKGPVSAEVTAQDYKGMIAEGRQYAKWAKNIYVKLPMTTDGLRACQALSSERIRVNMTLIFSANQALLAAKAGAAFVSPFIGRLDDAGEDGMKLIEEIMQIYDNYGYDTEVLVASVRHPRHVTDAAKLGADICTMPYSIFEKLVKHPLTDVGLAKFMEDWSKAKVSKKK